MSGQLGHVTDDTGLIYMRARYYDPQTGRFVSEDPGKNNCNWFIYSSDNPTNRVDPDGRVDLNAYASILEDILNQCGGAAKFFFNMDLFKAAKTDEEAVEILKDLRSTMAGMQSSASATGAECVVASDEDYLLENQAGAAGWAVGARTSIASSAVIAESIIQVIDLEIALDSGVAL